jgi:hypothetical protein
MKMRIFVKFESRTRAGFEAFHAGTFAGWAITLSRIFAGLLRNGSKIV